MLSLSLTRLLLNTQCASFLNVQSHENKHCRFRHSREKKVLYSENFFMRFYYCESERVGVRFAKRTL
jgi:hypothetical protein